MHTVSLTNRCAPQKLMNHPSIFLSILFVFLTLNIRATNGIIVDSKSLYGIDCVIIPLRIERHKKNTPAIINR